jgi:hypothetical protein
MGEPDSAQEEQQLGPASAKVKTSTKNYALRSGVYPVSGVLVRENLRRVDTRLTSSLRSESGLAPGAVFTSPWWGGVRGGGMHGNMHEAVCIRPNHGVFHGTPTPTLPHRKGEGAIIDSM